MEKRRKNSRAKGAAGERELAQFFRELGVDARRGQQFNGLEGQDVVTGLRGFHVECKRVEAFRLYDAMAQAKEDGKDKVPVVFHRSNGRPWVAVFEGQVAVELMKIYEERSSQVLKIMEEIG